MTEPNFDLLMSLLTMPEEQHPITLPPELVDKWVGMFEHWPDIDVFSDIAQWGANQELEACCEYISGQGRWFATPEYRLAELRAARRPKPPSLKEQSLASLDVVIECLKALVPGAPVDGNHIETIRTALNQLDD